VKATARSATILGGAVLLMLAAGAAIVNWGPKSEDWARPTSATADDASTDASSVQDQLRAKVRPGPIKPSEQAALEEAMNDRFPRGSHVPSHLAFYFDGAPTSCGDVRPNGSGRLRRYIYRNDYVLAEGDASSSDFEMFWEVCQAAGRRD